ncbi:MAG: ABC transporter substrate-binding protein [Actinobacteria bacterium]|nr:ABC transporter substrate-binding protein [Actinomycetota bacterium]
MRGNPFRFFLLLVAVLLAVGTAACGGDGETGGGGDTAAQEGEEQEGGTLVFGTAADPVVLDGALVSDGESLRVIDQIFETLIGLKPGTTELEPLLATDWEANEDGTEWTFNLREGVQFHDGEPFNADAVCFNFDRWYNFEGSFQNPSATYYWQTVFGGFAQTDPKSGAPEDSLFSSCEVVDENTVKITLTSGSASFLGALSLTAFAIASPKALEEFGADEGNVDEEGIFHPTGTFGTEHPIGTGPFKFDSWTRNDRLTLVKNEEYWGDGAGIDTLIFRPIPDNAARLQALQNGEIHGYDLVEPQDMETISSSEDLQLLDRPAFNVGYVGINQTHEPLDDVEVRKAIAHALDRQAVVDNFYAGRGEVAHAFMPPSLEGYAEDVVQYEHNPDEARQTLQSAGAGNAAITFCYPTDVSRPYMPDPKRNFEAFAADLREVGLNVKARSAPWSPDYLGLVDEGKCPLYLLGWTGDFGDPDNFVGTFFQTQQKAWGFNNEEIFKILDEAEVETDLDARVALYEDANRMIAEFVPGVPYVHTEPALAFHQCVEGYEPSPVSLEPFALVTLNDCPQ